MSNDALDKAITVREGEQIDQVVIQDYLRDQLGNNEEILAIDQFPSGFSNLTYLLKTNKNEYVLRKPPIGTNIKSAHDMGREYKVLSLLKPVYPYVPEPIAYEETGNVIGSPFYIMERIKGVILRNRSPKGVDLTTSLMNLISKEAINHLADLHQLDLEKSGLNDFGKPSGYVARQVNGWADRYEKSKTDEILDMENAFAWLKENMPNEDQMNPSFIHNDFKYDNLVLSPENLGEIKAVLDWEMATVGDPLMDLGTTLAYWGEPKDSDVLKPFNLTWLPGNLNREEVVSQYFSKRGISEQSMIFYYVFGAAKVGVICQQIYARFKKGITKDPRFKMLLYVTQACGYNTKMAIKLNRISNLY